MKAVFPFVTMCLVLNTAFADDGSDDSSRRDINFASVKAGALILESSVGAKGYDNLLNEDKDKYGITECANKEKWVVIGLSEHVLIRSVVLASYEKYSSLVKDFQLLSSMTHPVTEWHDFGTYRAKPVLGSQTFNLTTPGWGRYLKLKFLSEYGDEHFCTLSQIRVHGSAAMETLQKDIELNDLEVQVMETVMLGGSSDRDEEPEPTLKVDIALNTSAHNDTMGEFIVGDETLRNVAEGNTIGADASQLNESKSITIDGNINESASTSNDTGGFDNSSIAVVDESQLITGGANDNEPLESVASVDAPTSSEVTLIGDQVIDSCDETAQPQLLPGLDSMSGNQSTRESIDFSEVNSSNSSSKIISKEANEQSGYIDNHELDDTSSDHRRSDGNEPPILESDNLLISRDHVVISAGHSSPDLLDDAPNSSENYDNYNASADGEKNSSVTNTSSSEACSAANSVSKTCTNSSAESDSKKEILSGNVSISPKDLSASESTASKGETDIVDAPPRMEDDNDELNHSSVDALSSNITGVVLSAPALAVDSLSVDCDSSTKEPSSNNTTTVWDAERKTNSVSTSETIIDENSEDGSNNKSDPLTIPGMHSDLSQSPTDENQILINSNAALHTDDDDPGQETGVLSDEIGPGLEFEINSGLSRTQNKAESCSTELLSGKDENCSSFMNISLVASSDPNNTVVELTSNNTSICENGLMVNVSSAPTKEAAAVNSGPSLVPKAIDSGILAATEQSINELNAMISSLNQTLALNDSVALGTNSAASTITESALNSSSVNISTPSKIRTVNISCLDSLRFADFKEKMMAKLEESTSTAPDSGASAAPAPPIGPVSQDSVFKPLISKIKKLEMRNLINEMYAIQVGECYRFIFSDVLSSWGPQGSMSSSASILMTSLSEAIDSIGAKTIHASQVLNQTLRSVQEQQDLLDRQAIQISMLINILDKTDSDWQSGFKIMRDSLNSENSSISSEKSAFFTKEANFLLDSLNSSALGENNTNIDLNSKREIFNIENGEIISRNESSFVYLLKTLSLVSEDFLEHENSTAISLLYLACLISCLSLGISIGMCGFLIVLVKRGERSPPKRDEQAVRRQ